MNVALRSIKNKHAVVKLAPKSVPRIAIGNLIDSMDWCDATRSHERSVYLRLREGVQGRRIFRLVAISIAALVALMFLVAANAPT